MSSSSTQGYVVALYNLTSIFLLPPANPPLIGHTQREIYRKMISLIFYPVRHIHMISVLAVLTPYQLNIQKEKAKYQEMW